MAKLCEGLKCKHAREPVILFIDNIGGITNFPAAEVGLMNSDDFHIIYDLNALNHLIGEYSARDPGQNIHVYLTYKEKKSEEKSALLETIGKSLDGNIKKTVSQFDELGKSFTVLLKLYLKFI